MYVYILFYFIVITTMTFIVSLINWHGASIMTTCRGVWQALSRNDVNNDSDL